MKGRFEHGVSVGDWMVLWVDNRGTIHTRDFDDPFACRDFIRDSQPNGTMYHRIVW